VEGLLVGGAFDYQGRSGSGAVGAAATSAFYANAFGLYLSYQVTEKVKTSLRAEYASGTRQTGAAAGVAIVGAPFSVAGATVSAGTVGSNVELVGLTGTVDYKLWENVISRAEVRWDHNAGGGKFYGNPTSAGGLDKNAFTLALNVIYKF